MGQSHSILNALGFGNHIHSYSRISSTELCTFENEGNSANQISQQQQRHFDHVTTARTDDSYLLIWLDEHSNEFSLNTEYIKNIFCRFYHECWSFYTQSHEFLIDIRSEKYRNDKIILIVSGSLAEQVLPQIQDIVPVVIIFCAHYNKYINLKKYHNVVDLCTDYETLKSLIHRELPSLKLCLNDNTPLKSMKSLVSTNIFESEDGLNTHDNIRSRSRSTPIGNETCFSYILIIDLLKQMPQTSESKNLWLGKCREYHRGNECALKQIADFSKEYKADDAIKWYTADAFVYKLVNRALRTEDITLWYLFRYFIVDMCKQMELVHQQQNYYEILTLYRGQSMSSKELELIHTNGLFCTTAFFSTSKEITVAKHFIGSIDEYNYQRVPVLFEITVDSININTVTFVDINQYFASKNDILGVEEEFLFTIGSIFRITAVERDEQHSKLWKIYMKATDDGKDIIQRQLDLMKNKYPNVKINLLFGRYLMDMNHLAKGKSYFQMLLHELIGFNYEQQYHEDLIFINNSLGELHIRTTNYKEAYQYFQTAYTIQSKYKLTMKLFTSYVFLGNYYKAIGDLLSAHRYYIDALRNMNENAERNKINIGIRLVRR